MRAEAERYISEHRVRALDHGPFRNTHNDSTGSGSDGESDARMDATMFSALWNQESGDPEILVPMRGGRNTSVTPRPTQNQQNLDQATGDGPLLDEKSSQLKIR